MKLIVMFGILMLTYIKSEPNINKRGVNDPVVDIVPIKPWFATKDNYNQETDSGRHGNKNLATGANKRDVEGNRITISSEIENEKLEKEAIQQSSNTGSQQCAYTFVIPHRLPSDSNICVNSRTTKAAEDNQNNFFTELHQDVLKAKSQIEDIKYEIIEERQQFPSSRVINVLEKNVGTLQQESRNMESRISQLYMQLMHEIINKRDNTVDIQRLENKILNFTIKHYALKVEHDELKVSHNALRTQVLKQAEQMDKLQRTIEMLVASSNTTERLISDERNSSQANEVNSPVAPITAATLTPGPFRDCTEAQRAGYTESGIFVLKLKHYKRRIRVWCDFDQDPGGWIVIQRRGKGRRVNFYRNMEAYEKGFGKLHGNFWLGLIKIHQLTTQPGINYKLHIDLEDWNGKKTFVEYQSFRVEGEDTNYKLKITHYSGNAGDSLTVHNNMGFTTMDKDNDHFRTNCAHSHRGGWWYNACARSNLNGVYYKDSHSRSFDGVFWMGWRGISYSLKSVSMMIRPTE